LVLLPGLEGTGTLFANLLPELPRDLKVIVRGYPQQQFLSYPDLVVWLADVVPKDGRYVLLGESFGSPLAVMFAATHPPNLAGIILSAGFISNPVRHLGFLPRLLAKPFLVQLRPPEFAIKYFIAGADAPKSLLQAIRNAQSAVNPTVFARRAQATLHVDARKEVCEVNVPLLYLQGTEDNLVHKSALEEIERLHPQTISLSIHAPHLLLQREPRAAADAITQFLEAQGLYNEEAL
jgi:pimeloyl-[acyl-carrier protein] methyl ester esterase